MRLPPESFETPVAVVDAARVEANARRAVATLAESGIAWRPHIKTHKCPGVARIQLAAGARGLTVATLREAEVMATVTDDLLLAYPPVGAAKLERLLRLAERVRLTVALDSDAALTELSRAAAPAGRTVGVLVEVDMGMGRVGVAGPEQAVELAGRAASLPGVEYRGVLFYPGHIRAPLAEAAADLDVLVGRLEALIQALERAGLAPAVVSGGSTPTVWASHRLPGMTECRAGTWIFNDRDIASLGACDPQDWAYSVCATVVSTSVAGQAVVDAGSKALAKEVLRGEGAGFGVLLDRPEVVVKGLSEEHGVLDLARTDWRPQVGERVRIVPNHVCVSVNLQDRLLADVDGRWEEWALPARGRGPYPG
ncbi:MAG: alanine racemase [Gemmatimonadota bacterium]